jgi:hypothetical protein
MHPAPASGRDRQLARIGRLLVADPAVADGQWHGYALVVRYGDGPIARRMTGFRYATDGHHEAATPSSAELGEAFDALRDATRVPGREPWGACVLRLWREGGRMAVEFEYDAPENWDIGPATLATVAARARPD